MPHRSVGAGRGAGRILGHALLLAVLALACGRPAFELSVIFAGPLEIEEGAEVRYQGVAIGSVRQVALVQPDPEQPARVELQVAIHDPEVTLREGDLFEITSDGLVGDAYLRITPSQQPSPPLEEGTQVVGVSPLATRVVDTAQKALEKLGRVAREQAELLVDQIADEIDEESMRPPPSEGDAAPDAPAPPAPVRPKD